MTYLGDRRSLDKKKLQMYLEAGHDRLSLKGCHEKKCSSHRADGLANCGTASENCLDDNKLDDDIESLAVINAKMLSETMKDPTCFIALR